MVAKKNIPNLYELIEQYREGVSILELSKEFGHSRTALTGAFVRENVKLRTASEQEKIKWRKMKQDPGIVARQLGGAWAASNGQHMLPEVKMRRALTCYKNKSHVHKGEAVIGGALESLGFGVDYQYPADAYLVDVAIPKLRIAVEVYSYNWKPRHAEHLHKRTEFLLSEGWLVVFAFIWRKSFGLWRPRNPDNTFAETVRVQPWFDPHKVALKVSALADRVKGGEVLGGQYCIVSGNGMPIRTPSGHLTSLPRVSRF